MSAMNHVTSHHVTCADQKALHMLGLQGRSRDYILGTTVDG